MNGEGRRTGGPSGRKPPTRGHHVPAPTALAPAPSNPNPNLQFRIVQESNIIEGTARVTHDIITPSALLPTYDVPGKKFTAKTGDVDFEVIVEPIAANPAQVDLTGWTVGYLQNIISSREFAKYNDCTIFFRYPTLPILDSATRSGGFPWTTVVARKDWNAATMNGGRYHVRFADSPGVTLPYRSPQSIGRPALGGQVMQAFREYVLNEGFVTWLVARFDHGGTTKELYLRNYLWRSELRVTQQPTTGFVPLTGLGHGTFAITAGAGVALLHQRDGVGLMPPKTIPPYALDQPIINLVPT